MSSESFAQWLAATMQNRGLSQADLAREVGVADAQISRWRRGQVVPSVRYLQRMATAFDVPRGTLERMAGYPTHDEVGAWLDPEMEAEVQALQARFRGLLEQGVPRELWDAYMQSCEALATSLSGSFGEAQEHIEAERRRRRHRNIGFRTQDQREPEGESRK